MLKFFRDGERVGSVIEQLSDPEFEKIVNRLKKLELLKRTNPSLSTPPKVHNQTVVNPLTDILSRNERRKNHPGGDDQPTHLKNSGLIGPDLDDDSVDDSADIPTSDIPPSDE